MTRTLQLTRRRLLATVLLPFATSVAGPRYRLDPSAPVFARSLQRLVPDTRTAAAVGEVYLQSRPEEKSLSWLTQTVFGADAFRERRGDEQELITQHVRTARLNDFRTDDLVVLDGWVVAR